MRLEPPPVTNERAVSGTEQGAALEEILLRLGMATGPNRELDEAILRFLGWKGSPLPAFKPTASIDFVSEEILPPGYEWLLETRSYRVTKARAWVKMFGRDQPRACTAYGDTPAIAFCIAALKALATISATRITGDDPAQQKAAVVP